MAAPEIRLRDQSKVQRTYGMASLTGLVQVSFVGFQMIMARVGGCASDGRVLSGSVTD